ncbi:MAG: hypothetical protein ACXABY_35675 [Candidatus Thorarchaeota archaeon]|jgi:hypothetical protein
MEVYSIYDTTTKEIKGTGRVDRPWCEANRDGSTALERIERYLTNNPGCDVIYLPQQELPDRAVYKVEGGQLVQWTAAELAAKEAPAIGWQTEVEALYPHLLGVVSEISYDQVDTYIEANVTNLAAARTFLKKLTKAVLYRT